ncbi:hypothetical protein ACFCX4_30530 [Kitasatospora sp. NPDC056327]|uniref:hypothetical protein n=1 Tax=Kitasatospora sp. NPDC056327 TaxID=3345785 RepID=UPI0035DDE6AD
MPAEPRHSVPPPAVGSAALCTVLPFVLLLALLAWVYPLTTRHHHGAHPHPAPRPASTAATPR